MNISVTHLRSNTGDKVRGVRLRSFGQGRESRYTGWILNMELPGMSKGGKSWRRIMNIAKEDKQMG